MSLILSVNILFSWFLQWPFLILSAFILSLIYFCYSLASSYVSESSYVSLHLLLLALCTLPPADVCCVCSFPLTDSTVPFLQWVSLDLSLVCPFCSLGMWSSFFFFLRQQMDVLGKEVGLGCNLWETFLLTNSIFLYLGTR